MNVGFVSLGCSKNLIDTEVTIGKFEQNDYRIVNDESKADIIVINTCGFIESAKEEAINAILEMIEYKKIRCKYVIVMGCLVQRYYDELTKELPEVDLFIKLDEYDVLWDKIEDLIKRNKVQKSKTKTSKKISEIKPMPMLTQEEFCSRVITTGNNYAYIKIGEGCSNKCTYCAIPYIRGPFVSRKKEDIIEEAKILAKEGIKELIVIAQDTTKYGIDLYGESKLAELLEDLSTINGIEWIRFLYSYPEGITEELINVVANNEKIAKYFDIPIQHISNNVLKRMNRKTSKEDIEKLIKNIKEKIPEVTLRTSLIVGFPGETEEDFKELQKFVEKVQFDKLGTFMYSKEDGTPAEKLPNQIHGNTKKSRYNKIMEKQQKISNKKLQDKIGKVYNVLVEDISNDGEYFIARTMQDVPEIDGLVYIKNDGQHDDIINEFVECEITDVSNYDLIGIFYEEKMLSPFNLLKLRRNNGEVVDITIRKNGNNYEYSIKGKRIGVFNPKVMYDNILMLENTVENELSGQIKDVVNQLRREDIKKESEITREIDTYIRELGERDYSIKQIRQIDLQKEDNRERKIDEKNEQKKLKEITQIKEKNNKLESTKDDINIKQQIELRERANNMSDMRKWLNGKVPHNIERIGVVETYEMKNLKDENRNKIKNDETTRYSLVAIGKDGKVEPLKNYIPELQQRDASGKNPTEQKLQVRSDGNVQKDAVLSEYELGKKIIQLDNKEYGKIEMNIGEEQRESTQTMGVQVRDSNTPEVISTQVRSTIGEFERNGEDTVGENIKEAEKHFEADKNDKIDERDIDGDKKTASHTHINNEDMKAAIDKIMENDKIASTYNRKDVERKILENHKNSGQKLDINQLTENTEEKMEQDSEQEHQSPSRGR